MVNSIDWLSLVLALVFFVYAHRSYKRLRFYQVMYYGHPDKGQSLFFEGVLFVSVALALFCAYNAVASVKGVFA
jgi:hypothetical protein